MKRSFCLSLIFAACIQIAGAQAPPAAAPPAAPPAAAAAPATPAPVALTDADLKAVEAPKPEVRAKGDPDGNLTGTVADIAVADAKKGITVSDVLNQVGNNKIAINFTWTLLCGFLIMFMQAVSACWPTG